MASPLRKSRAQEKRGAQRLGGTVNSGSGNGTYRKNDVRTADLSIEYKYTDKKQFTLRLDELLQAERHALLDDRAMAFGISFGTHHNYIVLTEEDFESMYLHPGDG